MCTPPFVGHFPALVGDYLGLVGYFPIVEGDVINQVILRESDSGEIHIAEATVHLNTIFFGLAGETTAAIQNQLPVNINGEVINTFEQLEEYAS